MNLIIKKLLLTFLISNFCLAANASAEQDQKLNIVTSFSILADMTKNVAGDKAEINTIVGRNSDAHAFEPTPKNVRQLAGADLLIINGLDFEPWIERLKQAAGFEATEVTASKNIEPLHLEAPGTIHDTDKNDHGAHTENEHAGHHHGDIDPHAWQSLGNAEIYINNIANALMQLDPKNQDYYQLNAAEYIKQLKELAKQIQTQIETIPKNKRVVLTSHDSFGYFAKEYDINFVSVTGLSSTAEPSARRIANIIQTIKTNHISAIFLENMINNSVLHQIARETNSIIGGTLYSDALAGDNSPASTYLGMMQSNANQIIHALKQSN